MEGSRRQEWETAMRARTKDKEERAEVSTWLPGLQQLCSCAITLLAVPGSAPCAWLSVQQMSGKVPHRELLSQSTGGAPWRGQGLQGHTSAGPSSAAGFHFCSQSSWVLLCKWNRGVNVGSKAEFYPSSEQGTGALVSYTLCHWVFLPSRKYRNTLLWWDWEGALVTVPNTAECLLCWCFYYLASFLTFKNKYTKLIHCIHQQCPRGMSS